MPKFLPEFCALRCAGEEAVLLPNGEVERMREPVSDVRCSLSVPNPRIYHSVDEIYDDGYHDDDESVDNNRSLNHRIIGRVDGENQERSHAIPRECLFCKNRPCKEYSKL